MHRAQRVRRYYSIYIYRQRKNESSIKMIYFMYCKNFYLYEQMKKNHEDKHPCGTKNKLSNVDQISLSWPICSLGHLVCQISSCPTWSNNTSNLWFTSMLSSLFKNCVQLFLVMSPDTLIYSFFSRNMYFLSFPVVTYWNGHVRQRHQYGWEVSDQNTTWTVYGMAFRTYRKQCRFHTSDFISIPIR